MLVIVLVVVVLVMFVERHPIADDSKITCRVAVRDVVLVVRDVVLANTCESSMAHTPWMQSVHVLLVLLKFSATRKRSVQKA